MKIKLTDSPVCKFRAWDIRNSKMVPDALILSETKQLVTVNAPYFNSPFSFFDGCKWMRYTGLNDAKEKEIYEGDIIESYGNRSIVEWIEFDDHQGWMIDTDDINLQIIGNIYETPELIPVIANE